MKIQIRRQDKGVYPLEDNAEIVGEYDELMEALKAWLNNAYRGSNGYHILLTEEGLPPISLRLTKDHCEKALNKMSAQLTSKMSTGRHL